MQISQNIRAARDSAKLTQVELAEMLGVGRSTYAEWERGTEPDINTLTKIAELTKTTLFDILGVPDPKESVTSLPRNVTDITGSENSKDISLRNLTEANLRLADSHLRLVALLETAMKDVSATKPQLGANYDQVALRLLARATWQGKFENEEQAFAKLIQDYEDLCEIAELRSVAASRGTIKQGSSKSVGTLGKKSLA